MTRLQDFRNDLTVKYNLTNDEIAEVFRYELNDLGIERPEWVSVTEKPGKLIVVDNEDPTSTISVDCDEC